jgi:hypothetical protein
MVNHQSIKRLLAGGLVIAAAGFPTAAQARYAEDGGGSPSASQVPIVGPSQAASSAVRTATPDGAFQWGDAGIGAAGAVILMSAGALGTGVARRRRVQRPVVG